MPLQGDAYHLEHSSVVVRRFDIPEDSPARPGIGYQDPILEEVIRRVGGENGGRDALEGFPSTDALFGFAVRAALDQQARRGRLGEDRVWNRLLAMGIEEGEVPGQEEVNTSSLQAIRYAAVIANELMKRQEGVENRVGGLESREVENFKGGQTDMQSSSLIILRGNSRKGSPELKTI